MKPTMESRSVRAAWAAGILGTLLMIAALVVVMIRVTRAPTVDADRVDERYRFLREVRRAESNALNQYAWQDRTREIVRLPIDRALELVEVEWQNPVAARSNLILRVETATAPLPKPPNPYE